MLTKNCVILVVLNLIVVITVLIVNRVIASVHTLTKYVYVPERFIFVGWKPR